MELGSKRSAVTAKGGSCQAPTPTASGGHDDNGTELTATASVTSQQCNSDGTATVTISGTVTSTGSRDSVEVYLSIDGGADSLVYVIQPGDFSNDGRIKTASYSITVTLPSGTHTAMLCFVQSGSQGRTPKKYCLPAPLSITVSCNTCAGTGPFGDIVGNPSLCTGQGDLTIPVHVKGNFGDDPRLIITGPNGFSLTVFMRHAGESCVYHYDWKPGTSAAAGTYTFKVDGNGTTLTFTANLRCNRHGASVDLPVTGALYQAQ
ncbi:MAG TPA: hypothetical protein VND93_27125 [Myxococcales bacterium]|nr:hypothetical protein [Myxococcales bacterium]